MINRIEIIPCARRNSGAKGAVALGVFYRSNDINSSDYENYLVDNKNFEELATTSILVQLIKAATTTIEAGVVYSGGTKNIQISRLLSVMAYDVLTGPTELTIFAVTPSSASLRWIDNTLYENGYLVERSLDGLNFDTVATTTPNSAEFVDQNVTAGTRYYYRVRAYNSGGYSELFKCVQYNYPSPE